MKRSSKITTFIIGIITVGAIVICVRTFTHAALGPSLQDSKITVTSTEEPVIPSDSSAWPSSLRIPSLQVQTEVQHVGISNKGTMAVPSNYTDVAWYREGVLPGHEGSAVFAGHYDNGFGRAGIFYKLKDLKPGDDIYVTLADTTELHFKVAATEQLPQDTTETGEIFSTEGIPRIRLITCDGVWNSELKTYSNRYIVTATLVNN
ncbi:class F sortase [Patescibacteria group bacterium]|nr:class F sortase [Patescibacteria group bacterium]